MSRLTGTDAKGLMEAYSAVYAPQELTEEQIWEEVETWVNSLLEEGYDLSEYTWEEMYEVYLSEAGIFDPSKFEWKPDFGKTELGAAIKRDPIGTLSNWKPRGGSAAPAGGGGARPAPAPAARPAAPARTPAAPAPARPAASAPAGGKPAPSAATPAPSTQTGDKAKDEATWRSANKGLATASDERARIRGTQQTDNPLMKDMRSRLPMNSPSVQSPDVAKLGKGNQSLVNNPNALKAATPAQATAAAPSTSASASGSVAPATAAAASTPKPTPVEPKASPAASSLQQSIRNRRLNMSFDLFDAIKGHLIDEGYADTEESALAIMANMSEEWRESISEKYAEYGYNAKDPLDDFHQYAKKGDKTNRRKVATIQQKNKILSGPPTKRV